MHPVEFREYGFKPDSFLNYRVSIQFSLNGFSFCLKEIHSGEIPYFKHLPFKVSNETGLVKKVGQVIRGEDMFDQTYENIIIYLSTKKFTLVPTALFQPDLAGEFLKFNFGSLNNEVIHFQSLLNSDQVLVYSVPQAMADELGSNLGNLLYEHSLVPLIQYAEARANEYSEFAIISFSDSGFYLLVFVEGKPVFVNYFQQTNENDLAFYLLTVLRELNLEAGSLKIFIGGETEKLPEIKIPGLKLPEFEFIVRKDSAVNVVTTGKVPFHKHFCLLV